MAQTSRPWNDVVVGDAGPYSDKNWQQLYQNIIGWGATRANVGVLYGTGTPPNSALRVQAQVAPTSSVDVLSGSALVQGIAYINTATVAFVIAANVSGNPRIDTVVLRADYALQTVRLAVLQGTPAASPAVPTLTQTTNVLWEIPLADIAVANGFGTITNANITRRYEHANSAPELSLDNVLNNSGGQLEDGDVVVWDTTADRAVTTSATFDNPLLAGVWRGRTAAAGYGRVQIKGIGYVNASAAITRGNYLVSSATIKRAAALINVSVGAVLGLALETTGGAGYVLAEISVHKTYLDQGFQPFASAPGWSATSAFATSTTLAANGGTALIPIVLSGHMLLQNLAFLNNDVASPRSWHADLYRDVYDNVNAIPRVATCNGELFTPGAASVRSQPFVGAPIYLVPGAYWLAIQNDHATNTFALGIQAVGGVFSNFNHKTKTTTNPNGATLDIIAATWVGVTGTPGVILRGRAAGDTVAW